MKTNANLSVYLFDQRSQQHVLTPKLMLFLVPTAAAAALLPALAAAVAALVNGVFILVSRRRSMCLQWHGNAHMTQF